MATKKNKLEKLGFVRAEWWVNADASGHYDSVTLRLVHKSDWYTDNVTVSFQRHRLDLEENTYASTVDDIRAATASSPWWDVGAAPYSIPYAPRFRDSPAASMRELTRLLAVMKALDIDSYADNVLGFEAALREAGVPVVCTFHIDRFTKSEWVIDVPADKRGKAREWSVGPVACRIMAEAERKRAEAAEARARESITQLQ